MDEEEHQRELEALHDEYAEKINFVKAQHAKELKCLWLFD